MSEEAKIESDIDEYLAVFERLFEKIMKAVGGTHKWSEVLKDHDQLRKVARSMRKRRKFKRGRVGQIERISLFCSKIDESRPFHLENYTDERDINTCLNAVYFYRAVVEVRRQDEEDDLVLQGKWKKGMEVRIRPKSPKVFDELYQDFLFSELSEKRLEKLAEDLLYNLISQTI